MRINWAPVVLITGGIAVCSFGVIQAVAMAQLTEAKQETPSITLNELAQLHEGDVKPSRKHTRKEICTGLIEEVRDAYRWHIRADSERSSEVLANTIQIYNGVRGDLYCRKDAFKIMEGVEHYGK